MRIKLFLLSTLLLCFLVAVAGVPDSKDFISVFSGSNLERQKELARQIGEAWENDQFFDQQSEDYDKIVKFCIDKLTQFNAEKYINFSTKEFNALPPEERATSNTNGLLLITLCIAKVENNKIALDFFAALEKEKAENKRFAAIEQLSRQYVRQYEDRQITKATRKMFEAEPESIKNSFLELIREPAYWNDKIKERFVYSFCHRIPMIERVRQDEESRTAVLAAIEEQFPLLIEKDISLIRRGYLELYSRLANREAALEWLKVILDTHREKISGQEVEIIQQKIKILRF